MAVIKVDPDWVGGYAKKVASAAAELSDGAAVLDTAPLGPEAFGSLGRTVRIADAYQRASSALRAQLDRGAESLAAAAESLTEVAGKYRTSDDDGAVALRRSGGE
ncbi:MULTISPECIES: hypothetical protein [Actinokineospora]|uniref:Excreted virulence factor EspC, type VII ESX diderm n=1 Tax=Actinokineospora fastidiosa TaxID=1816 RepID=A0A918L9N4_9PSEU|nr:MULTISPECIES: hypothetical protein [Actinokineospora]UVS82133.1 hypothetical protein Actkin_05898 [Actinokineospora sp. UTMC 2448]GGS23341.1 hypothetical protein GCM10010171_15430 [Actinokineospora fastidiosa]